MTLIRYSPRPVASYVRTIRAKAGSISTGPAASAILAGRLEAWNLAYLSHDYEASLQHPDPHFTVRVLHTTQFVIETGEIDIGGMLLPEKCIMHFMQAPPARAVKLLLGMRLLKQTPLYVSYGDAWLETIQNRGFALSCDSPVPVGSVTAAAAYLQRFTRGPA